jgi:trans-2-enoyl-CoA reductase
MTKVESIEEEISKLSPQEVAELRDWMAEQDWKEWDEQIERDSLSGRLDELFAKSSSLAAL